MKFATPPEQACPDCGGPTSCAASETLLAHLAALGKPEYSHFRLTFSQTFNSLGTFIGPYLGAVLFLKGLETKQCEATTQAARLTSLAGIDRAYFWICGFIIALALLFIVFRKTVTEAAPAPSQEIARRGIVAVVSDALSSRWALLGGLAIFLGILVPSLAFLPLGRETKGLLLGMAVATTVGAIPSIASVRPRPRLHPMSRPTSSGTTPRP